MTPSQSNPFSALASSTVNPSVGGGLDFKAITTPQMNVSSSQANPQGVLDMLSKSNPQSLTDLLMPLYSQLFNTQTGQLATTRDTQSAEGRSIAQSDAMKRGLTGSSIESSGIQAANTGANMNYNQGYASLLSQLLAQYTGAAGQDVSGQQSYYQNIAQALGQTYASNVQQDQFNRQLQEGMSQAGQNRLASQQGSIINGLFSLGSAALKRQQ